MVWITHVEVYPQRYADAPGYRIEESPRGGWDVYLDPPADVLGWPIGEVLADAPREND